MRHADDSLWTKPLTTSWTLSRAAKFAAVAVAACLVLSSNAARAQDDEDDDSSFEDKIIHKLMTGIGATNMESSGIEYRERSPLVVPPKLDLPKPEATTTETLAPNWPKDPDLQRRKEAKAVNAKAKPTPQEAARPLTPSELKSVRADSKGGTTDPSQPGTNQNNPMLSPKQLGFSGSFGSLFGGNKAETAPFTGEPTRETLTQPPSGYQTPSPNYAYGTGPKEALGATRTDIMTGKEVRY